MIALAAKKAIFSPISRPVQVTITAEPTKAIVNCVIPEANLSMITTLAASLRDTYRSSIIALTTSPPNPDVGVMKLYAVDVRRM